ncbi:MAG: HpcH/HpaI aldolase/citrate lyase family protein [Bacteroidia bacterium]
MKIKTNKLKQQLQNGQKTYGIWNGIPHSYVAEICAGSGFDWVCIDAEHGPFDLNSILSNLQAIQSHDASAIVRIPSADPIMIKQLLDAGAQNILCPMIESATQAETIAKAMVYPPEGIRGVGTAQARAAQWDRVRDYLHVANEQMCCMAQIESVKGVEALDEILTVKGVDVLFMGPADLAATMGYLGQAGHPDVVKTVKECIRKIVRAGKIAGFLTLSKELIQAYTDEGALVIGVGVDTLLLAESARSMAEGYRRG